MSASSRSPRGRFRAQLGPTELREAVVAVARHARPRRPETVSQRLFDANRAAAGYPDLIGARAIVLRLNTDATIHRSWGEWLETLLDEDRDLTQTLVARTRSQPVIRAERVAERAALRGGDATPGADEERAIREDLHQYVYFSLRRVANALKVPTLTPDQYAAARDRLVERVPVLADSLVTVGQIERHMHWAEALTTAELAPPPTAAERRAEADLIRGMPIPEAIALFVRHHGQWPTAKVLRAYFAVAGLALADGAQATERNRVPARELLQAEGVPVPAEDAVFRDAEAAFNLPDADVGAPSLSRRSTDRERCVRGLMIWLDQLEPGERRGQSAYRAFAVGKPDCPSPSAFNRNGLPGFAALRAEAERRLAAGEKP